MNYLMSVSNDEWMNGRKDEQVSEVLKKGQGSNNRCYRCYLGGVRK